MKTTTGVRRMLAGCAILAAVTTSAVACSSDAGSTAASEGSAASAFPVTIDSALGSVTIEQEPERVVTIGWGSQDVALALGVVPVGMQDMTGDTGDDTGILPWDAELLGDTEPELLSYTTDEVPYEQILALEPDVILAVNSGLTAEQYARLSDIAPTVAYPGEAWLTSWEDQTTIVGQALGLSQEAEDLVDQTNDLIAQAKADHPEFTGKTIAFASGTTADALNVYLATDARVTLLQQLGFTISSSVPTEADSFAVPVSLENLASIDSDVLVSWYLSTDIQESLESSPLFSSIPAVARDGYVAITDPPLVYATSAVSVLSLPWMLDAYLPLLQAAAEGASPPA
ncbi:MAG: iron-siderophore ABC transporter substrate-binding protein [Microbacterium sp.]|uniref:iron-siderophore ABC transporter substrate-binding protein n=1 Tax=Microbacterium sp. TaxID=51671 RepID=UPI0039E64082